MKFSIRKAVAQDASTLCAAERSWAGVPGHLVSLPDELKPTDFAKKIEELGKNANSRYVVATNEGGKLVGHALLDRMTLKSISHILRLTIVVHPGYDGQGIGRLLMEDLITWARTASKTKKIELLVRSSNQRAIALYRKFGFEEEGRLRNRIKISDGKFLDDVTMGLLLE